MIVLYRILTQVIMSPKRIQLSRDEAISETSARELVYEVLLHWKTSPTSVIIVRYTEGKMNTVSRSLVELLRMSD